MSSFIFQENSKMMETYLALSAALAAHDESVHGRKNR